MREETRGAGALDGSMKSIVYTQTGAPEVFKLIEREAAEPGPDEVRVRVIVSGVNPTDWKARTGSGDGATLPAPQVPNQDGAGIVDVVGANVTHVTPGDRVWIWDAAFKRTEGTAQELTNIPARQVVKLPAGASFDIGASVGIPALTAHRALTAREGGPDELGPGTLAGTTILVAGGAGAVGHAAIQLAIWSGATVITTVSSDAKAELATRAGAQHVINYTTEDVVARIRDIDAAGVAVIVEVNPNVNIDIDLEVIAMGGTIAIYAGSGSEKLAFPERAIMMKNVRIQGIMTYTTRPEQKHAAVHAVSAAIRDGALNVGEENGLPLMRFPLERTGDAHKAVEDSAVGKVLIDVASA
ncbi:MAG: NADPH:quinone reductase [Glaciihabitans sp.]|nr:NADPH:quinone reductase [Glaciihabitans sp.]